VICSLTRAAAAVVQGRIDLPKGNAATLHSLAFHSLDRPSIAEIGVLAKQWNGQPDLPPGWALHLPQEAIDEGVVSEQGQGTALALYSRLRASGSADWGGLESFVEAWDDFKAQTGSMDFQDLLDLALLECPTAPGDPVCFVTDETQDFTPVAHQLADQWGAAATHYVVAGDGAQTLYQWAGADWRSMLEPLPEGHERVLSRSYRLPVEVHRYAEEWLSRHSPPMCDNRVYRPREAEGSVRHVNTDWRDGDGLAGIVASLLEGETGMENSPDPTVMVLTTCAYMLEPTIAALRNLGLAYHNPYRRANGRWNPLREREGAVSTLHRLRMWLSDVWSDDGAVAWLEMLPAKTCWRVPKTTALESLEGRRGLTIRDLAPLLQDSALNAQAGQDGAWLIENVPLKYRGPLAYAYRLWQHDPASLGTPPRVVVGTIHSVKGGEASAVVLCPDLSPAGQAERGTEEGRDASIRLHYVGVTRASESVTICAPASAKASVYN